MNEQTIQLFGSKNSDDWETPQELFDVLNKEFQFNLDVSADERNTKCERYITKQKNALGEAWVYDGVTPGRVWCNPPYSMVKQFLRKGTEEIRSWNCMICVFLTFANTDTQWFHDYCYQKPNVELRFIKGRLKFKGKNKNGVEVNNSAMRPSMLIIMRREKPL